MFSESSASRICFLCIDCNLRHRGRMSQFFFFPFYAWRAVKPLLFVVTAALRGDETVEKPKIKRKKKILLCLDFCTCQRLERRKLQIIPYIGATSNSCKLLLWFALRRVAESELLHSSLLKGIIKNNLVSSRSLAKNDNKCVFKGVLLTYWPVDRIFLKKGSKRKEVHPLTDSKDSWFDERKSHSWLIVR